MMMLSHWLAVIPCSKNVSFKRQNSRILRRPQDDRKSGGIVIQRPPPINVILGPPKDLAVLPFYEAFANIG
jgi:hypothetical protein